MLGALNWQAALRPSHDTPTPRNSRMQKSASGLGLGIEGPDFYTPSPRSIFT